MPSDTAFLGDLSAGVQVAGAYDSLGETVDGMPTRSTSVLGGGSLSISPREISSTVENLRALGIDIDANNAVLRGLRSAVVTQYSLYMLYSAWTAMRKAQAAKELAVASAEVTALAITQQWHRIAQGVAAAALVASAFTVGEKVGSGDWNLPSFDKGDPYARREAARKMEAVNR